MGLVEISGIRTPLVLFDRVHFRPTDLKAFLRATLRPMYTNFVRERVPKKCDYFGINISKSVQKRSFLACFFKKLSAVNNFWSK